MSDTLYENIAPYYYQLKGFYPWQNLLWQQLYNDNIENERFPQALLFAGMSGIGKKDFAFYLARGLLCQSPRKNPATQLMEPCQIHGQKQNEHRQMCRSCRLFTVANHPDLFHLSTPEDKKVIPVDDIRELIQWSVLVSQSGGKKVIIIEPAEAMNINAANSLLKTLEEPVSNTIIILLAQQKQMLLPTIRSRCQTIDFILPDNQIALQWLLEQGVAQAELMLSLVSGAPLRAKEISQGEQLDVRQTIINGLLSIIEHSTDPVLVAENFFKATKLKTNVRQAKKKQAKKKQVGKKQLAFSAYDVIYWFDSLVSDLARLAYHCPKEDLVNIDHYNHLQTLANKLYLSDLLHLSELINKAYYEIQGSVNINQLFETLIIAWNNCKK